MAALPQLQNLSGAATRHPKSECSSFTVKGTYGAPPNVGVWDHGSHHPIQVVLAWSPDPGNVRTAQVDPRPLRCRLGNRVVGFWLFSVLYRFRPHWAVGVCVRLVLPPDGTADEPFGYLGVSHHNGLPGLQILSVHRPLL